MRYDAELLRPQGRFKDIGRAMDLPPGWLRMLRGVSGLVWVLVGLNAEANWHRILDPLCDDKTASRRAS